jgi:signal transduction histidine kinase
MVMSGRVLVLGNGVDSKTLRRALERRGLTVELEGDAAAAMARACSGAADAVVVHTLPSGVSPFELCRRIKEAQPRTLVYLVLGLEQPPELVRAAEAGADGFFVTPLDVTDVGERVHTALARPRDDESESRRLMGLVAAAGAELRRARLAAGVRTPRRDTKSDLIEFSYRAIHDLKEPLFVVSSAVEFVSGRHREQLSPDAQRMLDRATGSARRMQRLIRDLLTYINAVSGDPALRPVECDTVVDRAITNLSVAIEEAGGEVTRDVLPTVIADEDRLSLVFQNLLDNSLKFHGQVPPSVHVSAARDRDGWRFTVRDNGIGVEEQYVQRVFEPFERLHDKGAYPGHGIGLALCKRIVEAHGGGIWLESQPGRGTTVHFTLPATG